MGSTHSVVGTGANVPPMMAFMYRMKAAHQEGLTCRRKVGRRRILLGWPWEHSVGCGARRGWQKREAHRCKFWARPSKFDYQKVIPEAFMKWKVRYSMAIGDLDVALKIEVMKDSQKVLKQKIGKVEQQRYEIKEYDGCEHGIALRANPENQVEEATRQAAGWFNRYPH